MKKLGLISVVAAAAMLAACGGGGADQPAPLAASSNLTAAVASSSVAGIAGEPFTFSGGVTNFGTASSTAVTLSTSTFNIAATEGTASGNLSFGSCIFTVTASTFAAGSKLAVGQMVRVHPCEINVATAGVNAEANAAARAVSFVLEGNASVAKNLTVDITSSGTVTVNGAAVGSVTLKPVTGASGG